ncbi:LTA synthase family protein [Dyella psychrodurans]|uniref:LTA synthase family protein n=1 Tax=Dyella psychrodurans TaxID=1927960 RepID=A0A370WX04_9GAMM|nr:LTA synthase family protein [Dyella psychrodurans]RDS80654.1 LTA synthase family protein [Dyella psychrodurans]
MAPAHSTHLSKRSIAGRIALVAAMVVAFVLLTGLLDGNDGVAASQLLTQPAFPLANAMPGVLAALLLLVMTRRAFLSFGLAYLAQAVMYGVNALKVANLGTPLVPADFRMVGQLRKGGMHILGSYLPHSPWPYLAILGGIALVLALWRLEPPLFAPRTGGRRLVGGSVLAAVLGTLVLGVPGWGNLYNGHKLWLEPWSAAATASHSGLVSSLVMFHLQDRHTKQKADPTAVGDLLQTTGDAVRARMQTPADPNTAMPDIVVIQSESFFDPSIVRGYEHANLTPNLTRLAAGGMSGPLHVPTYGGGTIRTEFEVLTGLSLRYFSNMQFPYLQLNDKVVPSMVRILRSHGYETVALHGNDPTFWNRNTAFKALGFDRFVSQSSFPADAAMDGKYMADSAMTDEIMAQLKDSGPPQFLFAISLEAHGPYDVTPNDAAARDAIPVPASVGPQDKIQMQNYLYHMQHADQELGRLAALMSQRSRPTLLLFYGDHLPGLTGAYRATGFVDGQDMLTEPGAWLLIDPRNPGNAQRVDMASWMLPGLLLERAGIHDDAYFALTQVLAPSLAQLTRAPGATPPPTDAQQQVFDKDMASVAVLRMKGKLDKLLPARLLPTSTAVAQERNADSTPSMGAMGMHR